MPQSLTEAFQGFDYTTVAHKHMYLHQSHTYIHAPLECPRKRRLARTQSIPTALHWDSPHHSSHSVHSSSPTAATAELQGGQAVQTRPHGSRTNAPPPPPSGPDRRSHEPGEPSPRGQDSEPRHQEEHVTSAAGSSATAQHAAPPAAGPARRVARRQPRPTAELISP